MELSKEYLAQKAKQPSAFKDVRDREKATEDSFHPAIQPRKVLKSVTIEAAFGELKGGRMYQMGRGRGSNFKVAAANAMRNLLKQPGLKAQRFSVCKATISFGTITVGDSNAKTNL